MTHLEILNNWDFYNCSSNFIIASNIKYCDFKYFKGLTVFRETSCIDFL